jgi:hypothetical protein
MDYTPSEIPFSPPLHYLPRQEARAFFKWYVSQIPERMAALEHAVRSDAAPEYRTWQADRSPDSLEVLGRWFAEHIRMVPVPEADKPARLEALRQEARRQNLPEKHWGILEVSPYEFDRQSCSLIIDVGMYLGEVLRQNCPNATWHLLVGGKNNVYYQKPVIKGPGRLVCEPKNLVHVMALKLVEKRTPPSDLRALFDIWSLYVCPPED